jgi:hypothetical protein
MQFVPFASTVSHSIPANIKFQFWGENATSGAIVPTLPDATKCPGTCIVVMKVDSSANTVTPTCSGAQKILNSSGLVASVAISAQGKSITIVSDGTQWAQISAT